MGKQECAVLFGHSDTVVFPRLKQHPHAAITGTVVGDMREYAISSRTSNAQNNLPMDCAYEDQAKRLWATTSNGRIDVRFV